MNKFERRSKESYNKKAINYDDTFDGKFTKKFKQIILDSLDVKDGDRLLDVACGNGRLLQMLSKKADIKGFGADISEKMIEEAKKLNPDMNFLLRAVIICRLKMILRILYRCAPLFIIFRILRILPRKLAEF